MSIKTLAVASAAVVLLGGYGLFSTWTIVPQGERCVVLHQGALGGEIGPGAHTKAPAPFTSFECLNTRQQKAEYGKDAQGDNGMTALTADQQQARNILFSVNWHVTNVQDLYTRFTDLDNFKATILDPKALLVFKNKLGQYTAANAIDRREELNSKVYDTLSKSLRGYPVMLDNVNIENINYSEGYLDAVEKMKEAQINQTKVVAENAQRRSKADAEAYYKTKTADAEAHAIQVRADALKENTEMPALIAAEKWDGHLPTTMPPGGTLPFLNLHSSN